MGASAWAFHAQQTRQSRHNRKSQTSEEAQPPTPPCAAFPEAATTIARKVKTAKADTADMADAADRHKKMHGIAHDAMDGHWGCCPSIERPWRGKSTAQIRTKIHRLWSQQLLVKVSQTDKADRADRAGKADKTEQTKAGPQRDASGATRATCRAPVAVAAPRKCVR